MPRRSPQQQVLDARDVLAEAYPAWGRGVLGITVLTHGVLGEGLSGDSWVVAADQLLLTLGRFRQVPDEQAERRWRDLSRFLQANWRTRSDRLRFWRSVVFRPSSFTRTQLESFGMLLSGGMTLVIGVLYYPALWLALQVLSALAGTLSGH